MSLQPDPQTDISIIVPVYNRRDEVRDLLESLSQQTVGGFEIVIVEDGSTDPCRDICEGYKGRLNLKYFHKDSEGRSIARNYGIERADGDFLSSSTLTVSSLQST